VYAVDGGSYFGGAAAVVAALFAAAALAALPAQAQTFRVASPAEAVDIVTADDGYMRNLTPADLSIRLRDSVEWWIAGTIGKVIPFLSEDSNNPAADSVFRAGFLVGIMIIPLVVSLSREIIRAVPISLREGYIGMGATRWETIRHVVLPTARIGIIGALMLALGRALGETIAVTMVIGGSNDVPASLFQPGSTIATRIATTLPEAGAEEKSVLIALGVILFFVSLGLSLAMRLAARQTAKLTASVK
jgi:ABC-type phosphate transport system permease subunit